MFFCRSEFKISNQRMQSFLKETKQETEFDIYDDLSYYDNQRIKEIVLKQNFLISKGYFDPKEYFNSIQLTSLDDSSQDQNIRKMLDNVPIQKRK